MALTTVTKFFKKLLLQEDSDTYAVEFDTSTVNITTSKSSYVYDKIVSGVDPANPTNFTTKGYVDTPQSLKDTFASSVTVNVTSIKSHTIDVTGALTLSLSNDAKGGVYVIILNIDSTGGYVVTTTALGTLDDNSSLIASATADATYVITIVIDDDSNKLYTITPFGA